MNEPIYKTETDSQTQKKTWLPSGDGWGGMECEFGIKGKLL